MVTSVLVTLNAEIQMTSHSWILPVWKFITRPSTYHCKPIRTCEVILSQQIMSEADVNEKNASQQCNAVTVVLLERAHAGRLRVPFFPEGKDSSSLWPQGDWSPDREAGKSLTLVWGVPYSQMRHMGHTNLQSNPYKEPVCILALSEKPSPSASSSSVIAISSPV